MKVIFLDLDGVLCLSSNWGTRFHGKVGWDQHFDRFDKKAVRVLNDIIRQTDCEIVISSDWRYHATLEQMGQMFVARGILKSPIDLTTKGKLQPGIDYPEELSFAVLTNSEQTRSYEIQKWVREHPEVVSWVAIDDMNMSNTYAFAFDYYRAKWGLQWFVHTPLSDQGIKQTGVKEKIIKILNK